MTNQKYSNLEKILLMNTHPAVIDSMPEKSGIYAKMIIAGYLKKDIDGKKEYLRKYYNEIKDTYKRKLEIMKEFNIEKDLNKNLLTDWEE